MTETTERAVTVSEEAVEAAARAIEDQALVSLGRDLGTIHRNEIVRAGLQAATPQIVADNAERIPAALRVLVSDWQANGNSRPLGDPTAATWHECALQLLRVLDGDR
jgi:hypothetical protein